jgi:hypothetical protein
MKDDLSIFWDVLKNAVFLIAIILFFVGWVYLSYYFKNFGISINDIRTDVFTYYLYGFYALQTFWPAITIAAFSTIILAIYYNRVRVKFFYVLIISLTFLLFPTLFLAAKVSAETEVDNMLSGRKQVFPLVFSFKGTYLNEMLADTASTQKLKQAGEDRENFQEFLNMMNNFKVKQFYENDDYYYVYIGNNSDPNTSILLYAMKKGFINSSYLIIDQSKTK